jgi:hypothetical protein
MVKPERSIQERENIGLELATSLLGLPKNERKKDLGLILVALPQVYIEGLSQYTSKARSQVLREFLDWGFRKFCEERGIQKELLA